MRRRFVVAAAACILLGAACGDDDAGLSIDELSGRTFASSSATEDGKPYPLATGTRLLIRFVDGRFSADAGCNDMSARIDIDDNRLVLDGGMESTLASCPDREKQESWFGRLLGDEPLVDVAPGRLVLTAGDRRAEFVEQDHETMTFLTGRTWLVTAVVTDGQSTAITDSAPLLFEEDGTFVSGSPECPAATGHVEFERGSIRVGGWAEGTCPPADKRSLVMSDTGRMTIERAGDVVRFRSARGTGFDLRAATT